MLRKRSLFYKNSGIAEFEQRQRIARIRRQAAVVTHFEERKCQSEDVVVKRALLVAQDPSSASIVSLQSTLVHCYGYSLHDISIYNNPNHSDHLMQPTRVNVLRQLRKLIMTSGLTHFFFYFSGQQGLRTCDRPAEKFIRIDEIYNLFQTLPVTAKITCILDTPLDPALLLHACLGYKFNRETKVFERVDRPLASVPLLVSFYKTEGELESLGKALIALIATPNANNYFDVLTVSGPESGLMASRMILASKIIEL